MGKCTNYPLLEMLHIQYDTMTQFKDVSILFTPIGLLSGIFLEINTICCLYWNLLSLYTKAMQLYRPLLRNVWLKKKIKINYIIPFREKSTHRNHYLMCPKHF